MARIIIINNPLNPADLVEREWVGPYCSDDGKSGFLNVFYPEGFPGTHRTVLNRQPLNVEDYDVVLGPEDEVVLMVAPGAPVVAAIGTVASAIASSAVLTSLVVGLALTAVSYMLAPKPGMPSLPETPASLARPKAESVYNLAVPTNQTRLGDPIPVAYGRNLLTPDYVAEPYGRYENNEQIVSMLLCLGQGDFNVHDVFLSDTPVSSFSRDVFNYKIYPPSLHQNQIGLIAADFDVHEDVIVSDEVSNIELTSPDIIEEFDATITGADTLTLAAPHAEVVVGAAINVGGTTYSITAVNGLDVTVNPATLLQETLVYDGSGASPQYNYYGIGLIERHLLFDTTDASWLAIAYGGVYEYPARIEFATGGLTPENYVATGVVYTTATNFGLETPTFTTATPPLAQSGDYSALDSLKVYATPSPGTPIRFGISAGAAALSFVVCNEYQTVDLIQFDYVFPQGLFDTDEQTGNFLRYAVDLEFTAIEIDIQGNDVIGGHRVTETSTTIASTNTPKRLSKMIRVPRGRYRASMRRLTQETNKNTVQDQVNWAGLVAYSNARYNTPGYGDVTLLAVKAQATNALNGSALNRISVLATRKLNGVLTTSADAAFRDIITNQIYGAARPSSEIDGHLSGEFNAVIDFDTTVWEAATTVAQAVDANLTPLANMFKVRMGDPSTVPRMRFAEGTTSSGLIVDGTLVRTYSLGNRSESDGIEIEYRDPVTYQPAYAIYPANSVRPQEVKLLGCTDAAVAEDRARLLWNQEQYNRFTWSFDSELDALVLEPGDTIEITPLDEAPVLCVVTEVEHKGQFSSSIVATEYDARVYA